MPFNNSISLCNPVLYSDNKAEPWSLVCEWNCPQVAAAEASVWISEGPPYFIYTWNYRTQLNPCFLQSKRGKGLEEQATLKAYKNNKLTFPSCWWTLRLYIITIPSTISSRDLSAIGWSGSSTGRPSSSPSLPWLPSTSGERETNRKEKQKVWKSKNCRCEVTVGWDLQLQEAEGGGVGSFFHQPALDNWHHTGVFFYFYSSQSTSCSLDTELSEHAAGLPSVKVTAASNQHEPCSSDSQSTCEADYTENHPTGKSFWIQEKWKLHQQRGTSLSGSVASISRKLLWHLMAFHVNDTKSLLFTQI